MRGQGEDRRGVEQADGCFGTDPPGEMDPLGEAQLPRQRPQPRPRRPLAGDDGLHARQLRQRLQQKREPLVSAQAAQEKHKISKFIFILFG